METQEWILHHNFSNIWKIIINSKFSFSFSMLTDGHYVWWQKSSVWQNFITISQCQMADSYFIFSIQMFYGHTVFLNLGRCMHLGKDICFSWKGFCLWTICWLFHLVFKICEKLIKLIIKTNNLELILKVNLDKYPTFSLVYVTTLLLYMQFELSYNFSSQ